MVRIARPVNSGKPQDRGRQRRLAHDCAFGEDFVVVIQPVFRAGGLLAVGVEQAAQRRALGDWHRLGRSGFGPQNQAVGEVDIAAADGHNPARDAAKRMHESSCITFADRKHVQCDFGGPLDQLIGKVHNRYTSRGAVDMPDFGRQLCLVQAAMKDRHLVSQAHEISDDERADEAGATDNEDTHRSMVTSSTITRTRGQPWSSRMGRGRNAVTDVLVRIKRAVLAGRYAFSQKARLEMEADGISELDVAESILNAVAIYKTLRSTSALRRQTKEYLYVIQSPNLDGLAIYSKGKLVREAGAEVYYFLVSSKRSL